VGLEVAHERGAALVGLVTTLGKIVFEGFACTPVGIPVGVVKLDEAYAPFDEATREQAVALARRAWRGLWSAKSLASLAKPCRATAAPAPPRARASNGAEGAMDRMTA
jgi:hypothetical protein